jgi:hypothetical protein
LNNVNQFRDKIVYFGVVNINENGKTIGAVDIWRSVLTKELFCEEKRLGILEIADYIGMPKLESDQKWAVAVSRKRSGKDRWKLIRIIKEGNVNFVANGDERQTGVNVVDYNVVDNEWWSFLVSDKVNRTVEISGGDRKE